MGLYRASSITFSSADTHPSCFVATLKSSLGFVAVAEGRWVGGYDGIRTVFYWEGRRVEYVGVVGLLACHLLALSYQELLRSMFLRFWILSRISSYYLVILLGAVAEYTLSMKSNT